MRAGASTSQAKIDHIEINTTIPGFQTVDVGSATRKVTAAPPIIQAGLGANF